VTDPGSISPVLAARMHPVIADSAPGTFNVDAESFRAAITPNTRAAILTHTGGIPLDMEPICQIAREQGIEIIEDASQAHGAEVSGRKVGTFGRLAAFSTMFSKHHASGGCGGLIFTKEEAVYQRLRAISDRGKDPSSPLFNPKDPGTFLFPALNFNMDELSAAIGASTLKKLPSTLRRRRELADRLPNGGPYFSLPLPETGLVAPFFHTLCIDPGMDKGQLTQQLQERGVPMNPDYRYLPAEWSWLRPHLSCDVRTPNATATRDASFNILFHERFKEDDMDWISRQLLLAVNCCGSAS
jgi:perosamine synthetase